MNVDPGDLIRYANSAKKREFVAEAISVEIARLQAKNAELVMSLEWAVSEIEAKTRYTKENQFGECLARANETLAKHKKD